MPLYNVLTTDRISLSFFATQNNLPGAFMIDKQM